jgi:hypothetical protein
MAESPYLYEVGTIRVNRFLTSQGCRFLRFLGFQALYDSYMYSPERLNNISITLRHISPLPFYMVSERQDP